MLVLSGQEIRERERALSAEWIEANTLGACAYQNILGENTKKEYSLLSIPYGNTRLTLVSGLRETITAGGEVFQTGVPPQDPSFSCLEKFFIDHHPRFLYNFRHTKIQKSVLICEEKNCTVIRYRGMEMKQDADLLLRPLLSMKEYDALSAPGPKNHRIAKEENYVRYDDGKGINLFFYFSSGKFLEAKEEISSEGETFLVPGAFSFTLREGEEVQFIVSSDRLKEEEVRDLYSRETEAREGLLNGLKIKNELYKNIILSARLYIRKKDGKHFLASSLINPRMSIQAVIHSAGLFLAMRRVDLLKELLLFLAKNIARGMVPEKKDENNGQWTYSSIDNSLWYLLLLYQFIEHTAEWKFIKDFLWENTRQIFHEYTNGILGTKPDSDGLLLSREDLNKGLMIEYGKGKDAALNILWYNGLKVIEMLAAKFADIGLHTRADEISYMVRKNLFAKFWNSSGHYLNSAIDRPPMNETDTSFRPYQVWALSLPFDDLLHLKTRSRLLDLIREKLLTPFGLRTLALDSPSFLKTYDAGQAASGASGVIHPYLMGHYITAALKIQNYSKTGRKEIRYLLMNFEKKLKQGAVGFLPQYVNSLPPHTNAGFPDYAPGLAQYVHVRTRELNSF